MAQRSRLVNALIGAVVSVVTAFLPFSPVVGGAVAGYLEREGGVSVGALSGVIAATPLALVIFLLVAVLDFFPGVAAVGGLLVLVVVVLAALYTVGLGALGGLLGVYLAREFAN